MPLLTTPAQLSRRSDLFYQLAQMNSAGLGLIDALRVLERNPPQRWMATPLGDVIRRLQEGNSFGEALAESGPWLPLFDKALLQAGEQSGQLPNCFKLLADYYAQRAQLARHVIGFTLYPLIVFHVAVLIFPVSKFTDLILKGAVIPYFAQKALILFPIYGVVFAVWFALQGTHGPRWSALVEHALGAVPLLGKARRQLAVARLSIALEALLSAGVTVIEAWELAAAASGSPALQRVFENARPQLLEGTTPGEMVASRSEFPRTFATLYQTGEMSGQLDDALRRSHTVFQDEGSRKLKQFVFGSAGLLVAAVMLMAAWQIIHFYLGYFQQVNDAIKMTP